MEKQLANGGVFWSSAIVKTWGEDLTAQIKYALSLLDEIKQLAVVPVSQFQVGAIVIDDEGNAYAGVNQEYAGAAMGQTVHAEQSAIAHAWSRGAREIRHVIVNYPPCGHCRQFMNELRDSDQIRIHLPEEQNLPLHGILPHDFGPAHLGMSERLLDQSRVELKATIAVEDDLMQAAIDAAQYSHAPYSGAYAGVALLLKDKSIITGRYAENAAYNPSLPPLQAALNLLHLRGLDTDSIVDAAMARVPGHGQAVHANALWQSLNVPKLRVIPVLPG
ncbi:cytidine deaminase [Cardiobacteriaceae bacterium TAE3-ERU3]|nr:cytidine deaminase [Cardiobacteriaceae bacterium TAE3-ERU3]